MGQSKSKLKLRDKINPQKATPITIIHPFNVQQVLQQYENIEFITFEIDQWTVKEVFEWISSFDFHDIYKNLFRYKYSDIPPSDEVKKNVLDILISNEINGFKFRIFEHNNDTERWNQRFEMAVILYTQKLMLTELFISNKKPQNLYINKDTMLVDSKTYIFNDIYIKNCTLSICNMGILVLISLNNIILDNGKINMNGRGYDNNAFELKPSYKDCEEYEYNIDKIYVGERGGMGESCSGGGRGGNGLLLECKNTLIVMNKSCISSKGSLFVHDCDYGCGDASGGAILIKCNDYYQDKTSIINSISETYNYGGERIVLKIGYLNRMKLYLIEGFMRKCCSNKIVVNVLRDIIDEYTECKMELKTFYGDMFINPKPIIVDGKWNVMSAKHTKKKTYFVDHDDSNDQTVTVPKDVDIPVDGYQTRHPNRPLRY
eukprot:271945_1